MMLNGFWCVFFAGMLGPLFLELLKIAAWRDVTKIKTKYGDWRYWMATAVPVYCMHISSFSCVRCERSPNSFTCAAGEPAEVTNRFEEVRWSSAGQQT